MKLATLIPLILFGLCQNSFAQFSLNGRIRDIDDAGVAFANVLLLNKSDSVLIKGGVSDADGNFTMAKISKGDYIIQSYMIGYAKSYSSEITFRAQKNITLPDIILHEDTQKLDEVVIKADKPLYEMVMGKMIVNVSSSITSSGQTVIDVLEKSPNVLINRQNGNISVGGKNGVIILINANEAE